MDKRYAQLSVEERVGNDRRAGAPVSGKRHHYPCPTEASHSTIF